jgi:hypothetical protein
MHKPLIFSSCLRPVSPITFVGAVFLSLFVPSPFFESASAWTEPVPSKPAPYSSVTGAQFTADGKRLLALIGGDRVAVWDVERPVPPKQEYKFIWIQKHDASAGHRITPHGKRLFLAGGDSAIRELDGDTGKELRAITTIPQFNKALFTPDCRFVVTNHEQYIGVRNLETVECVYVLAMPKLPDEQWPYIAISPDGKRLLSWATYGPLREWDLTTGKQSRVLLPEDVPRRIESVSFLPNSSVIVIKLARKHLFLDARTGEPANMPEWIASFEGYVGYFSPDMQMVETSHRADDEPVSTLRDASSGEILYTFPRLEIDPDGRPDSNKKHYTTPGSIVFTPDGTRALLARWIDHPRWHILDPDVRAGLIWDVARGAQCGALTYQR